MLIRFVTILCFSVLILELLIVLVNIFMKKRAHRIAFLRSFKRGKCAIIFLTAVPLYFIGYLYAGKGFLNAFFSAVGDIINMVVLKFNIGNIEKLMQADAFYSFTIYFCFVLVTLNALIFTVSLTNQYIWCAFQAFRATMTRKDKLFLFGNNPENIDIYLSDHKRNKVIVDDISGKESEQLYMRRIAFLSSHTYDSVIRKIFRLVKKFDREYILVVNTGDDEKNILICETIIDHIKSASEDLQKRLFLKTKVFVFGDPRYDTLYGDVVSDGFGCVHYINKYQRIAMDFIDRYPLSKFMDEEQIDYATSLLRENVEINVLLIGFGKTNQQLFLTSVANNQFLTQGKGDPELKKVKYHIYDKDAVENNKNLNHNYYRYQHECADLCEEDYLPFPTQPAEETYYRLDINDCAFYRQIRTIVTRCEHDANFVVIAFGTDLENIDMAQKLIEKREEWNLKNLVIFVKVRVWHKEQTLLEESGCYFIGNERDVVYHIDKITGDKIYRMAQMRNEVYDLEYSITHGDGVEVNDEYIKKNHDQSYRNWYMRKSQMERESSLYCCLSLRSKLNLMGLDYCEATETDIPGLSEEEYLRQYAGTDLPDTGKYSVTANGKLIVSYTLDFAESRRRNMAIHEHQRWNSFMISKGMIPASRSQIRDEITVGKDGKPQHTNGKNYAVRRHGNLTTFDGLVEFRKIVAERDGCTEESVDVIKYDYQLLDDAYWLLTANGYKIIPNTKLF